jgi:hypothetical protein
MSQNHRRAAPEIDPTKKSSLFEVPLKDCCRENGFHFITYLYLTSSAAPAPLTHSTSSGLLAERMSNAVASAQSSPILLPRQCASLRYCALPLSAPRCIDLTRPNKYATDHFSQPAFLPRHSLTISPCHSTKPRHATETPLPRVHIRAAI